MKKTLLGIMGMAAVIGLAVWINRPQSDESARGDESDGRSVEKPVAMSDTSNAADNALNEVGSVSPEPELSDTVKLLTGFDGKNHSYQEYMAVVRDLGDDLSNEEIVALRSMLDSNGGPLSNKSSTSANAIKNDVLAHLINLQTLPEGMGQQIVEMYANSDNDPVWRDYCIQFMTPFYERCSATTNLTTEYAESAEPEESEKSVDELTMIRASMVAALDERDGSFAGTSLIGLEQLSRKHEEFDRDAILTKAVEIASDRSASPASRLTALRMASQTSSELDSGSRAATLDTARSLAQAGDTILLRCAAIVTLGEMGGDSDRELLESYTYADNGQIAKAAEIALEKMDVQAE